jgi:hypothetical protein
MEFFFYDKVTGKIVMTGMVPDNDVPYQKPPSHCALARGHANMDEQYFSEGQLCYRPYIDAVISKTELPADASSVVQLSKLPDPCTITYSGPGFSLTKEVTGGSAEFTTDAPGEHTIKIEAFPYKDKEVTFHAI